MPGPRSPSLTRPPRDRAPRERRQAMRGQGVMRRLLDALGQSIDARAIGGDSAAAARRAARAAVAGALTNLSRDEEVRGERDDAICLHEAIRGDPRATCHSIGRRVAASRPDLTPRLHRRHSTAFCPAGRPARRFDSRPWTTRSGRTAAPAPQRRRRARSERWQCCCPSHSATPRCERVATIAVAANAGGFPAATAMALGWSRFR